MGIGREEAGQDEIRGQRIIGVVTPYKHFFNQWCEEHGIASKPNVLIVWISKKEDTFGVRFDEIKKGIDWSTINDVWLQSLTRLKTPLAKMGITVDDYKIDNFNAPYGRMTMNHLIADTQKELFDMVDKIGVQRKWVQDYGTYKEHFDISLSKKKLAIQYGAIEIGFRDYARKVNERKGKYNA